ncbi:hypothetical protein BDW22DRAFT_1433772 [Trametopsis cervina]|nr:hypothetical protein BDW22DRAFT_1433772 [Trametopsis cervina]
MPRATATTRGRGKGRGRGRAVASSSPTKRGRKAVVESDDEGGIVDEGSEYQGSDNDGQPPPVKKTRQVQVVVPSRKKASSTPEWVSLEADESAEVSDSGQEEGDEDQLQDEGEEIGSDIDQVSEPDEVAFTRPSTSPVRKSKVLPVQSPPTPSPKYVYQLH